MAEDNSSDAIKALGIPLLEKNEGGVKDAEEPKRSLFSIPKELACVLVLSNTIMGAGILGLPHAFAKTGLVVGVVLLCLSAFLSGMGLHMLAQSARTVGVYPSSIYKTTAAARPAAAPLIDLAVALKCWGVATSHLVVVADMGPRALRGLAPGVAQGALWLRRGPWVTAAALGLAPLAAARDLRALRHTSALAVAFVLFATGLSVAYLFELYVPACLLRGGGGSREEAAFHLGGGAGTGGGGGGPACRGSVGPAEGWISTLDVLSVYVFAFTCAQNIFPVANDLRYRPKKTVDGVIYTCIGGSLTIYLIFAISGYLTFGDNVASDIFESYPNSKLVTLMRLFSALMVCFCFPLQAHPARNSILSLIKVFGSQSMSNAVANGSSFAHYIVSFMIVAVSWVIALNVSDLGLVQSVIGATGSTIVTLILPGLVYSNINFAPQDKQNPWKKNYAKFHMWLGVLIIPVCLTFIFFFNGEG